MTTKALAAPPNGGAWRLRTVMVREAAPELADVLGTHLRGPQDCARIMHMLYDDSPQEVFAAFYLNTRHRIVGFKEVTRGTLDSALIHPRDIYGTALNANAAAVIIAHNHPSGDPTSSAEDRAVTRQLAEAGRALGIPLVDHVIIGAWGEGYTSLADELQPRRTL